MYHSIVRRIALRNFERVNQKDYGALLKDCDPNISHRFGGAHALGGMRHDREALRRWFERLGRVLPTLHLDVTDVWVKGGPHNTTIIMRWELPRRTKTVRHTVTVGCISSRCGGEKSSISTLTRILKRSLQAC